MAARVRATLPGEVPTSWKRPKRTTVVLLGFVAIAYAAFRRLAIPDAEALDPAWLADAVVTGFVFVYTAALLVWARFLANRAALPRRLAWVVALVPGALDLGVIVTGMIPPLLHTATVVASIAVLTFGEVRWRRRQRARLQAAMKRTHCAPSK